MCIQVLTGLCEVVNEEVDFEGGGIRGAETYSAPKISLDSGSKRNYPELRNIDRFRELNQVQV